MNGKAKIGLFLGAALLLAACPGRGSIDPRNMDSNLRTWFVKNTLNYDIEVQATYLALDTPGAGQWYEKAPASWSAMIRIAPNETRQVMDYVDCATIAVWRASDGSLLNDAFGDRHLGKTELTAEIPDAALQYDASLPDNDGESVIRDDRYSLEDIPWDRYPIACEFGHPVPALADRRIAFPIDGTSWAMVIRLNPAAPCFR